MTLEDFFTLTEMKDGLSSITRVDELVSVIQNANECPTNNKGDTIRQWSTVASTLEATKHEECLVHFVQLNGLSFLKEWLEEATDPSTDTSVINMEEVIIALLASLENLPVNKKTVIASGIEVVIKQLLDHKSLKIQEKARKLHDKWKCGLGDATYCIDQKEEKTSEGDPSVTCEQSKSYENGVRSGNIAVRINSCNKESKEGSQARESKDTECDNQNIAGCSEVIINQDSTEKASVSTSNQFHPSTSTISFAASLEASNPPISSPVLHSSACAVNSVGSPEHPALKSVKCENVDNQSEVPSLKDTLDTVEDDTPDDNEGNGSPRDTGHNTLTSTMPVSETPCVGNVEPAMLCNDLASQDTYSSLSKSVTPDCNTQVVDNVLLKPEMNNVSILASVGKGFEECHDTRSNAGAETPYKTKMFVRTDGKMRGTNSQDDFKVNKGDVITHTASLNIAENKVIELEQKSELELGCADDALEVARQVAIQVEREVVDYREPFCSSPDFNSGEIAGASCSEERKYNQPAAEESSGTSSCEKEHRDGSSNSKESSEITETLCSDPEKHEQDVESKLLIIPVQEPTAKSDNDKCIFDLNADICNEEPECSKSLPDEPVNVSAPIAIVASARGTPLLPVTPSHFEEGLRWKGSAVTSAFRPATCRRTPDSERVVSSTKQKATSIEIDLNVADGCDEVVEPTSAKQFPASCSLPSENSSVEVSSRKAERLHLDLNRAGDEDASVFPPGQFRLQQTAERSLSSVSSSSRRHSMKDFDLNDNPTLMDGDISQNFNKFSSKFMTSVGSKLDDPVAMIMGSKLAVDRKDTHMQLIPPNVLNMVNTVFPRPLMPYAHMGTTAYGYNGVPVGPTMPAPQAFYSPSSIPYLVDTRTQTVVPNVPGAGGFNAATSARPPFFTSVPTGPSHANLYGSFHPGFDLNSGMTLLDVGTKEGGNFKQLFLQGQNGLVQEQVKATPHPSSSGSTLKRKEPETGWEPYPYGYKQVQQWQ